MPKVTNIHNITEKCYDMWQRMSAAVCSSAHVQTEGNYEQWTMKLTAHIHQLK